MIRKTISLNNKDGKFAAYPLLEAKFEISIDSGYLIKQEVISKRILIRQNTLTLIQGAVFNNVVKNIRSLLESNSFIIKNLEPYSSFSNLKFLLHVVKKNVAGLVAVEIVQNKIKISFYGNLFAKQKIQSLVSDYVFSLYGLKRLVINEKLKSNLISEIIFGLNLVRMAHDSRFNDVVCDLAGHKSAKVRRNVVRIIGELDPWKNDSLLKNCLADADSEVRWRAAICLSKSEESTRSELIIELINNKKNVFRHIKDIEKWELVYVLIDNQQHAFFENILLREMNKPNIPEVTTIFLSIFYKWKRYELITPFTCSKNDIIREMALKLLVQAKQISGADIRLNDFPWIAELSRISETPIVIPLLKERVQGMLVGLGIGDAFGAQIEFMKKKELLLEFGQFDNFIGNIRRPAPIGGCTDDTELTLETLKVISKIGTANPFLIADAIAEKIKRLDFEDEPNTGYGQNTINSGRMLWTGLSWRLITNKNNTCGGAMRISPLVLLFSTDDQKLKEAVIRTTKLTHGGIHAASGSVVVAYLLSKLIVQKNKHQPEMKLIHDAADFIYELDSEMSDKLRKVFELLQNNNDIESDTLLGTSSNAMDTIPYAVYSFFKYSQTFVPMLQNSAFVDGDSDSIAAISGAFFGAYHGLNSIPKSIRNVFPYEPAILFEVNRFDYK